MGRFIRENWVTVISAKQSFRIYGLLCGHLIIFEVCPSNFVGPLEIFSHELPSRSQSRHMLVV